MRAILIAATLAACQPSRDPSATPAGQPLDGVKAFFAAIDAGSCPQLVAASSGALAHEIDARGCEHTLAEYQHHRLHLVAVHGADPDGRDPHAFLAHVTISRDGKDEDIVVRVEASGGAWRMTTL